VWRHRFYTARPEMLVNIGPTKTMAQTELDQIRLLSCCLACGTVDPYAPTEQHNASALA
jgi:hypothetical protein